MNREYLRVNRSRWKTQVALLLGEGERVPAPPPPTPTHPLTVQILQYMGTGTGWMQLPGVFSFQVSKIPNDPNTHPLPTLTFMQSVR